MRLRTTHLDGQAEQSPGAGADLETSRTDMNSPLTRVWWIVVAVLAFVAAGVGVAQQGFPERPGDWEVTTKTDAVPGPPIVQHFCLTSETWVKGLTQNPSCKIQDNSDKGPERYRL